MTGGDNIRRIRQWKDLRQEEFGKIADVSSMAVSQWENDRAIPRMGAVQRIADHFGISKSEIIDDENTSTYPPGAIIPTPPRKAYAPLLGRVHAGDAQMPEILKDNVALPYEVWDRHRDGYFLQVEGNCMSKVYPEGCYIFVDRRMEPQNGSIAVVSIDGSDYVMRRLYRGATTMILSPDSWDDEYEDIVITGEDDRMVRFEGVVVWFQASKEME